MAKTKTVRLEEPKREAPYTTFSWGGTIRYACSMCAFDCGSEEKILEHIDAVHVPKAPPAAASGLVIADKNYNVVLPAQPESRVLASVDITEEDLKDWTK